MVNMEQLNQRYNPYSILEDIGVRLTYDEEGYERKRKQVDLFVEKIMQGDFNYISLVGNGDRPNSLDFLQYFYNALSPTERYKATIDTYLNNGYNFPKDLIIGLKKNKPLDYLAGLPMGCTGMEMITVYRASQTPLCSKLKYEVSWTTSRSVAKWFLERYTRNNKIAYLYSGKIRKQDIIAFTNDRDEYEVIQHGGVRNISILE